MVWEGYGSGTDIGGASIHARRYDATGAPLKDQFQANTFTTDDQLYPVVSADSAGDFVVAWHSYGSNGTDSSSTSIQGQSFAASGTPIGSEFQINTYTTSYQTFPSLVHRPSGDFLVVWDSRGSFGDDSGPLGNYSIQGQLMSSQIFADGFESGDTSFWSAAVP